MQGQRHEKSIEQCERLARVLTGKFEPDMRSSSRAALTHLERTVGLQKGE
jgi:hypothetical protein